MAKNGKRVGWTIVGVLLAVATVVVASLLIMNSKKPSTEGYQPIQEFKAAFESLGGDKKAEEKKPEYDLEKTVKVINSLEVAQHEVKDFDAFLEYLAKQDYEGVAPEVLEAKKRMMPVLQEIYELQKEHDDLNLWTTLVQKLSADPVQVMGEMAPGVSEGIMEGGVTGMMAIMEFKNVAKYVFKQYKEEQKLKGKLKKKIQKIQKDYLNYLEDFTPVYTKYMTEWDKLCIDKDRAYINLYNGQPDEVVSDCDKILANYPTNREALLLKAYGHTLCAGKADNKQPLIMTDSVVRTEKDRQLTEAQSTLDRYMDLYPSQAAPALVVQGILYDSQGLHAKAQTCYDQAAVEYPRQSEQLTDMLNSYRARTYLNGSREGLYLLSLYRSTMEGIGFFSPNLIKATHYDEAGDFDNCAKEIYNHFFRRSNQTTYDGLLTDMRMCEQYMPASFNKLLPERTYIDIEIAKKGKFLGLASDESAIDVKVTNRSDFDLENLRVFLCIHFTDMYAEDYYVLKLPTFNRVPVRGTAKTEGVELNYLDKDFNEISDVRAIAMTDKSICWIDNVYNSSDNVDYNKAHAVNYEQLAKTLDSSARQSRDSYLKAISKSDKTYRHSILSNTRVSAATSGGKLLRKAKPVLNIEMPRELILIDPTFTMGEGVKPTENYLKGSYIHLAFDTSIADGQQKVIYVTSPYLNYKVTIVNEKGALKVQNVEQLGE
jgi:tetratricopeptide (TPR) repeat protein